MEAYDWGGETPESIGEVPFDVILGTDVVYYEHLYAPFVQASATEFPIIVQFNSSPLSRRFTLLYVCVRAFLAAKRRSIDGHDSEVVFVVPGPFFLSFPTYTSSNKRRLPLSGTLVCCYAYHAHPLLLADRRSNAPLDQIR